MGAAHSFDMSAFQAKGLAVESIFLGAMGLWSEMSHRREWINFKI
jgi:hypothetical protein